MFAEISLYGYKQSTCNIILYPTDGTWCKWMKWSSCSVRQGNGIIVRKRFCRSSNNNNDSFHVMSCSGQHTEIRRCYLPGGNTVIPIKYNMCTYYIGTTSKFRDRTYHIGNLII